MSTEENKALVRRGWEDGFNRGDLDVLDEVLASDFICHDPNSSTGEVRGPEAIKASIGWLRSAFPDARMTVEDQIAEGEKVVTRMTMRGTHEGEFGDVAPTGRQVEVAWMEIDRISGGKQEEMWANWDLMGLLKQIGAIT